MKITLNHKRLSQALQYTSRSVSAKPNIPILSNVFLEVTESSINLAATNLDMGIKLWIPGQVETQGSTTVNAKYVSDFVSATNSENVVLELKDTSLMVNSDGSKASFNTIPADEFPVLPKIGNKPIFKISAVEFVESINKVIFACSTDLSSGRIQQSGVLFEVDKVNNEINFIGLDGFRLSKRVSQIKDVDGEFVKEEIIVPARYLNEFIKIVADHPEVEDIEVYLSESNSQIVLKLEDIEFSMRLLEGPYPDYKRIMPDSKNFSFEVKKSEIENAIKIANTFARGNLGNKTLFDLDLETSKVILKSAVAEVGEGETEMMVSNPDGQSDLKTAYTLKYMQDVVNHISGDIIIFETKGPLAASVFKDKDDTQFIHLVMPMRRDS